jgi:phosphoglycolate phosphatase
MLYKAVVLDLDGTLVESHIDYDKMGEEIKELLDRMGIKTHIEDRRKAYMVIRGGADSLLEYGLPEENLNQTFNELDKILNKIELEAIPTTTLKPHAQETLQKLREHGYKLGIATRGHAEYALKTLNKFNLRSYFNGVLARDETQYPKPDPRHLLSAISLIGARPEETLYIGDTTTDLSTSLAANIDFIGYWRDEEWTQRFMDGGCTRMIKDLYELVELLC